jgi:glycine reductase complex component B subunit alpha and beta
MRLQVGSVPVRDISVEGTIALDDGVLTLDPEELRALIMEDPHFADAHVRAVKPGESTRIINVLDVVEPRWKVSGAGGVFPGFVSPATTVGDGRTHRLAGVAVVESSVPVPGESTVFRERLIDMTGPGSALTPFGRTLNVVLELTPNMAFFPPGCDVVKDVLSGGPEAAEYTTAVQAAGLRVAARLGRAAAHATPVDVETFELPPCDRALPRVVCAIQGLSLTAFLYGVRIPFTLGTLAHPNEFFDGAVVEWNRGYAGATYWAENHPLLADLVRRHGRDLNFLGVLLFGGVTPTTAEKEACSSAVARIAGLLRADAALFIGLNGSNHAVDLMLAIQKCERAGIKSALIYNDVGDGPDDPGFIFAVPEADAIVNAGSRVQAVTLPRMETVIGGDRLVDPAIDPHGEITVPMRYLHSSVDPYGHSRRTVRFE